MGFYGKHFDELHHDGHDFFLVDEIITNTSHYYINHSIGRAAWARERSKFGRFLVS